MSIEAHEVKFTKLSWWMVMLRAVVGIVFGLFLLTDPLDTVKAFIWVFGVFVVADGLLTIAYGMGVFGRPSHRGLIIARGLLAVTAGVIAMAWPGIAGLAIFYLVAIWALVAGAVEIGESFSLREDQYSLWYFALISGILYALLGILMLAAPEKAVIGLIWLIGVMTVVAGASLLAVAIAARGHFAYKRVPPARREE